MNRRYRARVDTDIALVCRIPATPMKSRIIDLSHSGCRLDLGLGHAETGATLSLETPEGDRFTGQVMWSRGAQVGVRFHRPLRRDLAIRWGVEKPDLTTQVEAAPVDYQASSGISHWLRRMASLFGNGAAKD